MKTDIRDNIPAWLELLGMGFVTLLLVRWMPAGIDVVLLIIGSVLMVVAFIWARIWISHLLPRAPVFLARQGSSPRYFRGARWRRR
ncbi:MAG: hypothetical protein ACREX3_03355 [Gammaproteobacteria bacterium]